jgi:predicted DNA-binding transcriptional regulator AlpA
MAQSPSEDDRFLNSKQVRDRYAGVSEMWLWRRLNDESGFPKPFEICGRRFWRLADLQRWEGMRAKAA